MCFPTLIYLVLHTQVLIYLSAEIIIIGKGIDFIGEEDIAIIFYITVKNICKDDLELSVNMLQCCETISPDETDCNSMMLIGGDMGILPSLYVKNLTLIYPNLYLMNRLGVCTIEVAYRNQLKKKEISTDVHFDTTKTCPKKQKKQGCETIDLDLRENCNPVDCLIKYSGTISYFNSECKRCQKVPICNTKLSGPFPDTVYSPFTNECVDTNIPILKRDLRDIENSHLGDNQTTTMINAICHYGTATESGECLCHDGWTTATNDEDMYESGVAQHHLCNIQVGDWNCINKTRIRVTAILIAIFAITVISKVLLLMCVMAWCYRHFRKPEKTCGRNIDPDDPFIILCDDVDSADRCLCYEAEEQIKAEYRKPNPKVLHSQTVNVSYYPCSVSAFSSLKTTTGSSQYTSKSGQSSNPSNTSTSANISFPEGESSEYTANTNETLYCEEDRGDNVDYGCYCAVNERELKETDDEVERKGHDKSTSASKSRELNVSK